MENAERISRKAEIVLKENIDKVFRLFGPVEEKKWAYGWDIAILYSDKSDFHTHMVFKTDSNNEVEDYYNWIISNLSFEDHYVEYTVYTENRLWIIRVECEQLDESKTKATIEYTFTSLNEVGIVLNEEAIEQVFYNNLKNWEVAINYYLETGEILKN